MSATSLLQKTKIIWIAKFPFLYSATNPCIQNIKKIKTVGWEVISVHNITPFHKNWIGILEIETEREVLEVPI